MTFLEDLALAEELADAADRITMARFRSGDLRVSTKPDRTPVTEADQQVEKALTVRLERERPSDLVVAEEFAAERSPGRRTWVIDPIDGTANYLRGVPIWATLIALLVDGRPAVGMVSAPAMGRRWWGSPDGALTLDVDGSTRRISVSAVTSLADASLAYSDPIGWPKGALERLTREVWRTRGYGDFYSHVLVAEGAVDIAVEPQLKAWDVAAPAAVVVAAGGSVCGLDGSAALVAEQALAVPHGLVSTNGALESAAVSRLQGH